MLVFFPGMNTQCYRCSQRAMVIAFIAASDRRAHEYRYSLSILDSRRRACMNQMACVRSSEFSHTVLTRLRVADLRAELRGLRGRIRLVTYDLRREGILRDRLVAVYEGYQNNPCICSS